MKTRIIYLLFLISVLLISCKKSSDPVDPGSNIVTTGDLLPKNNEISGWPALNSCTCDKWTAGNTSELQTAIDGGYELFAKYGFVEASMQRYSGTVNNESNVMLEIQVYDQTNQTNANSVFDDPNNVYPNPIIPKNPPSSKSQIKKEYASYSMKFAKNKFYVYLTILSKDDKSQDVLEIFAKNIADKIK